MRQENRQTVCNYVERKLRELYSFKDTNLDNIEYDYIKRIKTSIQYSSKHVDAIINTYNIADVDLLVTKLKELDRLGPGKVTRDRMVFVYGEEEGNTRWEQYKNRQAFSNTFEYKKNKGILNNKEEFDNYNKNRASTRENFIKRHGEEEGSEKWETYCKRQGYTNSKEYLGEERYAKVCALKANTRENYVARYGEIEGNVRWERYVSTVPIGGCSSSSQVCFWKLDKLPLFKDKQVYFYEKNREYGVAHDDGYYKYDFVCLDYLLCIEYHGDHYHGNPRTYGPNDFLKARGMTKTKAKDKWEQDSIKEKTLLEERGIQTIVVWESDWLENENLVIERIENYVKTRCL